MAEPSAALVRQCTEAGLRLAADGDRWDVVLDTPERRNAQTPATWRALAAVGEAVAAAGPRVVVLRASGPSFSAGLDRAMFGAGLPGEASLSQMASSDAVTLDDTIEGYQRGFTWWREVDAVTVAVVQGHAVGAGFQLALACDLRLLAADATLRMAETSLGLVPDLAGTAPLVELVGYPRALEICVTGRAVGAAEAARLGLAEAVVPVEGLDAAVDQLVAALTTAPAGAVTATKHLLAAAVGAPVEDQVVRERASQAGRLRALVEESGATGR